MLTEGGKTLPTMDNLHGDMDDVEYTLGTVVGICRAFTEIDNVVTITFAHGGCPTANAAGEPMARLFRPRKGDSVKHSTRIYDQILRAAQGRPLSQ